MYPGASCAGRTCVQHPLSSVIKISRSCQASVLTSISSMQSRVHTSWFVLGCSGLTCYECAVDWLIGLLRQVQLPMLSVSRAPYWLLGCISTSPSPSAWCARCLSVSDCIGSCVSLLMRHLLCGRGQSSCTLACRLMLSALFCALKLAVLDVIKTGV